MTSHTQWIEHNGHPILYSNYARLTEAEYLHAMDETLRVLLSRPNSTVLTVTDVSHSHPSRAIMAKAGELAAAAKAAGITTIDAVIGVGRLQRPIAQAVRRDMHFAGNLEEAKEWLTRQVQR
ncbi:MAG TPA: hypothetical protein PKM78_09135 [Anaerolineae bacterium]|nr:hypothetical protein [Anaerolineae bacterium]HNU05458.1 hypothetical protein [Anaerolineae bacterium]